MPHSYHHAVSSARRFGGAPEDYTAIHTWFDRSKEIVADFRHRALRHHAEGCFAAEALFGATITNADGRAVPVRLIAEQHIMEDLGHIPSFADWVRCIKPQPWMGRSGHLADVRSTDDGDKPAAKPTCDGGETIALLSRALRTIRSSGHGIATRHPRTSGALAWYAGQSVPNGQAVADLIAAGWLVQDDDTGGLRVDAWPEFAGPRPD